jgi:hypothetical protein
VWICPEQDTLFGVSFSFFTKENRFLLQRGIEKYFQPCYNNENRTPTSHVLERMIGNGSDEIPGNPSVGEG